MNNLRERCKAIGCTGGIRDHSVATCVLGVVHTHDVHWHGVLWRCGDDDLFAASAAVQLGLGLLAEDACGLADIIGTSRAPANCTWVLLVEHLNAFTVHDQELLATITFH